MKYEYEKLRQDYGDFALPAISITVEGKGFEENQAGMIIGDATVDLTCGYEASEAVYRIYNCTSEEDGAYLWDELKPYISLGSCAVIKMGYAGALEKVFCGFTARVEFAGGAEELPCVEVTLMDIKGAMMAGSFVKRLPLNSYGEAVKDILRKQEYSSLGQKGLMEKVKVAVTPDKQSEKQGQTGGIQMDFESDYEFILKAAKKFGYEFFTELGTVHFRKTGEDKTVLLHLGLGKGLLSHRISYDIRGIVREVEVRSPEDVTGELITAKEKSKNQLSYGNKVNAVLDGSKKVYIDSGIHTKEEAAARAKALLEKRACKFGSLHCECIGIPVLSPGHYIEIGGLGRGPDNLFYLTGVRHVLSGDKGYYSCLTGQAASLKKG